MNPIFIFSPLCFLHLAFLFDAQRLAPHTSHPVRRWIHFYTQVQAQIQFRIATLHSFESTSSDPGLGLNPVPCLAGMQTAVINQRSDDQLCRAVER